MVRLTKRTSSGESNPLADKATGLWFRRKGRKGKWQRYDEAPPYDGSVHWYKQAEDAGWHAFRVSDMKPVKKGRRS